MRTPIHPLTHPAGAGLPASPGAALLLRGVAQGGDSPPTAPTAPPLPSAALATLLPNAAARSSDGDRTALGPHAGPYEASAPDDFARWVAELSRSRRIVDLSAPPPEPVEPREEPAEDPVTTATPRSALGRRLALAAAALLVAAVVAWLS
jgi:hypothetical protein